MRTFFPVPGEFVSFEPGTKYGRVVSVLPGPDNSSVLIFLEEEPGQSPATLKKYRLERGEFRVRPFCASWK